MPTAPVLAINFSILISDGRIFGAAPEFGALILVVTFSGSKTAIQNIFESLKSRIRFVLRRVALPC
jgi:hypothetical protein